MSQRNVNLKSRDFSQDAVRNVQQATQSGLATIDRFRKQAEINKKASEEAMRIGMATTEQLQLKYSEKVGQAPTEVKTELYKYVREESVKIGDAKAKATRPGASQEDVLEYQTLLNNSLSNLDAIATYSVNASESQNIFKGHLNAVKTNANTGRLSNEALQNTDMISFDAALASNQISGFKVYTDPKTGHVNMSYDGAKPRDIWAANEAFKSTGENLKSYVITQDENITGSTYLTKSNNKIKDFKDLEPIKSTKTIYNRATNTERKTIVSGVTDYEDKLTKNHMDFLLQETTAPQFNKTWTQLQNLAYTDEKFNDIAWSTFTQADMSSDESIKNAIKNLSEEEIALADEDKNKELSVEEYRKIQGEIRKTAAKGLAKLYDVNFGQPVETTLTEQEVINKYKINKTDGSFAVTSKNAESFYKDYTNTYLPVANAINKLESAKEFDLLKFYDTPIAKKALKEEFNYNPTKQKISTASEIKQAFDKINKGKKSTDEGYIEIPNEIAEYPNGIFITNADVTDQFEGGFELVANEEFIEMKDGKLTDEGKRNLARTLNVDNSLFDDANNPGYISEVNKRLKQSKKQIKPALK